MSRNFGACSFPSVERLFAGMSGQGDFSQEHLSQGEDATQFPETLVDDEHRGSSWCAQKTSTPSPKLQSFEGVETPQKDEPLMLFCLLWFLNYSNCIWIASLGAQMKLVSKAS